MRPKQNVDNGAGSMNRSLAPATMVAFLLLSSGGALLSHEQELLPDGDFERETVGKAPGGWSTFTKGTEPSVHVAQPGAGSSKKCIRGQRSRHRGLVALKRSFVGQQRIQIDFSFAFSKGSGRSLNLWTLDPQARDAAQLNLCIQNGALRQFDGRTRTWVILSRNVKPTTDPQRPIWHRLRAIVDAKRPGIDFWFSSPGSTTLPEKRTVTRHAYRTGQPISGIALVSGERIAPGAWYLIDDLRITAGNDLPAPHDPEPLPKPFTLWTGSTIPSDPGKIPFVTGVKHQTIHRATRDGYRFLHGSAIVQHRGVLYANWANSPTHENGPRETLQGRRSRDGGKTWSDVEMIGPGFVGPERHSHGVLLVHQDRVWTLCARFGKGTKGKRFPGLKAEAFVLNAKTSRWESKGIVMENCWPYDEPVRMSNGNFITGGQDKDGLPVVAISQGEDLTRKWKTIAIPYDSRLAPAFAETTVWAEGKKVMAIIRGGGSVAWVAISEDHGRTWAKAVAGNLPMPRAKAYLGKLSTGQLYLISNLKNRDTLIISVSKPGEWTFERTWRIRHGKSIPPRFPGRAKSSQWSYPYAHEHDGNLYVVYSIGKEDCGLSVVPIRSLKMGASD